MLGRILLCTSLTAVALAASPRSAEACGACDCYDHDLDLVPSFSRKLPLNARLFARLPSTDTSVVRWTRESDQAEVDIELTPAGGPENAFWISPRDLLDPDTGYRITTGPDREWVLTTGQTTDTIAPEEASGSIAQPGPIGSCTGVRGAVIHLDRLSSGPDSPDAMVVQIDVTGPSSVERLFLRGSVGTPQDFPFGAVTSGDAACLGAQVLKDARPGVTYTAKVTAFDAAGNSKSFDLPSFGLADLEAGSCGTLSGSSGGAGCALGAGSAEDLGALAPLALLALARLGRRVTRRR